MPAAEALADARRRRPRRLLGRGRDDRRRGRRRRHRDGRLERPAQRLRAGLLSAAGASAGRDPDVGGDRVALGRRRGTPRGAAARRRLDRRARASTGSSWDRTGRGRRRSSTSPRPSRIPPTGTVEVLGETPRRGRHADAARIDRHARAGPGAADPRPLHRLRGRPHRGDREHRPPPRPDHRRRPRPRRSPDGRNRRRAPARASVRRLLPGRAPAPPPRPRP